MIVQCLWAGTTWHSVAVVAELRRAVDECGENFETVSENGLQRSLKRSIKAICVKYGLCYTPTRYIITLVTALRSPAL